MRLVDNWRLVLTRAWSARLMYCAMVLSGCEAALPFLDGALPIPPRAFALLAFAVTALALWARIVCQPSVHEDANPKN